jgi:predicted N-acetyltransferase YhbS
VNSIRTTFFAGRLELSEMGDFSSCIPSTRSLAMLIRPFRPEDLPELKRITVEAFTGVSIDEGVERLYGAINGHDWRWRKARHLDDDVVRDANGIFVAEVDGRVVGGITTWQDRAAGIGDRVWDAS